LDALGLDALGLDALGLNALGLNALGLNALGLNALGLDALGLDARDLDARDSDGLGPGHDASGFVVLGCTPGGVVGSTGQPGGPGVGTGGAGAIIGAITPGSASLAAGRDAAVTVAEWRRLGDGIGVGGTVARRPTVILLVIGRPMTTGAARSTEDPAAARGTGEAATRLPIADAAVGSAATGVPPRGSTGPLAAASADPRGPASVPGPTGTGLSACAPGSCSAAVVARTPSSPAVCPYPIAQMPNASSAPMLRRSRLSRLVSLLMSPSHHPKYCFRPFYGDRTTLASRRDGRPA
jgi:hypothetical protein